MLSEKSAGTIRATLPAVGGAIGEITINFYDRLFAAHPALPRDLFNRGNQASGEQQRALAGSVAAFATALLDHPGVRPDALLSRIAHKHASLGVTRDQYRVVHTHLFAAIAEVLGDAVTDEVAAAWDEVYWLMANALIAIEARLYAEAGAEPGSTLRDHRVVGRRAETDEVTTFLVRPADGSAPPPFRPGQYVSVQVELADGAHQIRQYSISGASADALRFSVKRIAGADTPDGEVSGHLHDRVHPGDLLKVGAPFGDVVLDDGDGPLLLVSAGIGCTPMIGMLSRLAADRSPRRITVVHADRDRSRHAFRADLDRYVAELPDAEAYVWYETTEPGRPAEPAAGRADADAAGRTGAVRTAVVRTGRADLAAVPAPPGVTALLCGPLPFLRAARAQLLARGVPAADIHYEVFGPDLWLGQE
ncbi:globin domain-containing protein [Streptomyces sp. NPDC020141]|uniref:globin domain-containing protein n=1 Tax=Streptomyces sp. NPDC020141 TaxID=3365065 RepID=UPI0037958191